MTSTTNNTASTTSDDEWVSVAGSTSKGIGKGPATNNDASLPMMSSDNESNNDNAGSDKVVVAGGDDANKDVPDDTEFGHCDDNTDDCYSSRSVDTSSFSMVHVAAMPPNDGSGNNSSSSSSSIVYNPMDNDMVFVDVPKSSSISSSPSLGGSIVDGHCPAEHVGHNLNGNHGYDDIMVLPNQCTDHTPEQVTTSFATAGQEEIDTSTMMMMTTTDVENDVDKFFFGSSQQHQQQQQQQHDDEDKKKKDENGLDLQLQVLDDLKIAQELQQSLNMDNEQSLKMGNNDDHALATALQEEFDLEENMDEDSMEDVFEEEEIDIQFLEKSSLLTDALVSSLDKFQKLNRWWLRCIPREHLSMLVLRFLTTASSNTSTPPIVRLAYKFTLSNEATYNRICLRGFSTNDYSNNICAAFMTYKGLPETPSRKRNRDGMSYYGSLPPAKQPSPPPPPTPRRTITDIDQMMGTNELSRDYMGRLKASRDGDGIERPSHHSGWLVAVVEAPNQSFMPNERTVSVRSGTATIKRANHPTLILPLVRFDNKYRYDDTVRQVMNTMTGISWGEYLSQGDSM